MTRMILLLALIASLQFSPDSTSQLIGTWLNRDPAAEGITQIAITNQGGVLRAQAWGACVPKDCDYGTADLTWKEGTSTAIFNQGSVVTTMYFVRLPNDNLLVVNKAEFKDSPEFKDPDHTDLFERQKLNPNDERARRFLKKVAETYSNLATAEFQFEDAYQTTDQATTTHSKYFTHLFISPSSKFREETSGSGEPAIEISDGKMRWRYFPESNQYTVYPAGNQRPIVDRYSSIDRVRGSTTIAGSERLGDVDVTVIKIERPDSVRTLYIDLKTNFILKDDSTVTSSRPTDTSTSNDVTTFSVARVLPNADEELFFFDPQKAHAKPREELQRKARTNSVGTPAPDFTLFDSQNKPFRLSELKGKAVLLDFWATWCVPCRAALPNVELLHRDFKDKGLIVLGVDDEDSKDQSAFLDKSGYTFRSLVDPTEHVKNLFKVGGIPTTVLIDRQGTIRVFELGGTSYDSLRESVRKMVIF